MISEKDVVRIKLPFPHINAGLAVRSHMYVCIKKGESKELVASQTYKTEHLKSDVPPFKYVIEESDINRNPFKWKSIIDCDKKFIIENAQIPNHLLTTSRPDICDDLYNDILGEIGQGNVNLHTIPVKSLTNINPAIKPIP